MNVYLDDERQTPTGWVQVRWPDEAIKLLETENVEALSLDHDLGDAERGTGYDVILTTPTSGERRSSAFTRSYRWKRSSLSLAHALTGNPMRGPHGPSRSNRRHRVRRFRSPFRRPTATCEGSDREPTRGRFRFATRRPRRGRDHSETPMELVALRVADCNRHDD